MRKGFTLIELLTVIAIIAILAGVIVVSTSKARMQARDAKRKANLNTVSATLEMYYANKRSYPLATNWTWDSLKSILVGFISEWPKDSQGSDGVFGQGYVYYSDGKKYVLDVKLENDSEAVTIEGEINGDLPAPSDGSEQISQFFFTGTYQQQGDGIHYRITNK